MEAIILAGGFGTRLRAAVPDLPKPLAPVAGRPFLHWLLDSLARAGISHVILATGYLGHMIEAAVGAVHAGMHVAYVKEEAPLGTGGAIWAALAHTSGDRVFAMNGDTWQAVDLRAMARLAPQADAVVTVRQVEDRARYGSVVVAEGRLLGTREKGEAGPGLINAGTYLLHRGLPAKRPHTGAFSFETEILERPTGLDIRVAEAGGRFLDIGTPVDFTAAQTLLPQWASATG